MLVNNFLAHVTLKNFGGGALVVARWLVPGRWRQPATQRRLQETDWQVKGDTRGQRPYFDCPRAENFSFRSTRSIICFK